MTGGGYTVNRFQQLFLLSLAQGQKLHKVDKALEKPEENLTELTVEAQTFADKTLPILKALQIA